jgi:uncharacterized membrane protein
MAIWHKIRPFLTSADKKRVAEAIGKAEQATTSEIHVHLTTMAAPSKPLIETAEHVFLAQGLEKTKHRNGVLILVVTGEQRFAIWGDSGIHAKAGQHLWDRSRHALEIHFKRHRYADGLVACVEEIGRELARHFPADGAKKRQLSDEVSED